MGLLDDYGVDLTEVDESAGYSVENGWYEFVVGDMFVRNGTDNKPDTSWIIIEFVLDDTGKTKQEWFELPSDGASPTEKELMKLGFLKTRLKNLGATDEMIADLDPGDFIGLSGTLELFTDKTGKYQNIRNVKVEAAEDPKPAARAPRAAKKADEEPQEEAEEAPAPAQKAAPKAAARKASPAAATGVKANPFAK